MDPTVAAFLRSWPAAPWTIGFCVLSLAVYCRGRHALKRRGSLQLGRRELLAFAAAIVAILLAVCSPLDAFAGLLFSAHMAQHLLLVFVAAPLVWLAAPQLPLMHGMPAPVLEIWIMPLVHLSVVRRFVRFITHPAIALLASTAALWLWHVPSLYKLALGSDLWHVVEHGCLFGTALLFWWPVILPRPSRTAWPRAAMLPYLFVAAVQGTALCAFLTFADRVLYARYESVPRLWGISALTDQAIAGALMWTVGTVVYLIAMVWLGQQCLHGTVGREQLAIVPEYAPQPIRSCGSSRRGRQLAFVGAPSTADTAIVRRPQAIARAGASGARSAMVLLDQFEASAARFARQLALPRAAVPARSVDLVLPAVAGPAQAFDLLAASIVGPILRARATRRILQAALLAAGVLVILDGLTGPQLAPLNLAGVLPWTHWRGLVVLALLIGGNFFCFACPFTLPAAAARRWMPARWEWPRWLRSKWPAIALLLAFFAAYEAFDLWASPWWTAWIALAYFLAATAINTLFRGTSFCKYVCPIGQFQFVLSLVSPWEVRVRDAAQCVSCSTRDCIRGGPSGPGCEMQLFAPRKTGNLDCTFCLDCVRTCPASNIGLLATAPGADVLHDAAEESETARLSTRLDVAVLILVLVFAAFANAAGMIAPVVDAQDWLASAFGLSQFVVEAAYLLLALLLLPGVAVMLAAGCARRLSRDSAPTATGIARFAVGLAPLGAAMWLAHYGFHLVTGAATCVAAAARFANDWGWTFAESERIVARCCAVEPPGWLLRAEILALDLGLLASLYFCYRIATNTFGLSRRGVAAFWPWAVLALILFAAGVWIVLSPMEMRGTITRTGPGNLGG